MNEQPSKTRWATGGGVLALVCWGSTIAFSRSLTEQLGTVTGASYILLLSGGLSTAHLMLDRRARGHLRRLPTAYWLGCGGLFVVYMVSLYLAIGLATGRQQVIEAGMINYLWPSLTLLLAVPLLHSRARWTLVPGMGLACAGVALAMTQSGPFAWSLFAANLRANALPYVSAGTAAVSWALYSNLSRRWAGDGEGNAVPLFLLATGLALAAMRPFFAETAEWTLRAGVELAYMAAIPTWLAYVLWDGAMRRGNLVVLASLSYFTPLLSAVISCAYLQVVPGPGLWIGCLLIIIGAAVCSRSVVQRAAESVP